MRETFRIWVGTEPPTQLRLTVALLTGRGKSRLQASGTHGAIADERSVHLKIPYYGTAEQSDRNAELTC